MNLDQKNVNWLYSELPSLVKENVIGQETAESLRSHYGPLESASPNGLLVRILSVAGSLLISLGIILLFAYNWDELTRVSKSIIAFIPLISSLGLGVFVFRRKFDSSVWKESTGLAISITAAACFGLASQAFQVGMDLESFYRNWLIASIPVLLAFNTRTNVILQSALSVFWIAYAGRNPTATDIVCLASIQGTLLYALIKDRRTANRQYLLFAFATSCGIGLFAIWGNTLEEIWPVWTSLFFATIFLWDTDSTNNVFKKQISGLLAKTAITVLCFILSFEDVWGISGLNIQIVDIDSILAVALLAILLAPYIYFSKRRIEHRAFADLAWSMAPFVILAANLLNDWLIVGETTSTIFNVYILALAIIAIRDGYRLSSVAKLNHGLLIIIALAITRFFDSDISMLIRGLSFIVIGFLFIVFNISILRSRKDLNS